MELLERKVLQGQYATESHIWQAWQCEPSPGEKSLGKLNPKPERLHARTTLCFGLTLKDGGKFWSIPIFLNMFLHPLNQTRA